VEAEGTPVFRGKFGVYNTSRDVKVTQKVNPDQFE